MLTVSVLERLMRDVLRSDSQKLVEQQSMGFNFHPRLHTFDPEFRPLRTIVFDDMDVLKKPLLSLAVFVACSATPTTRALVVVSDGFRARDGLDLDLQTRFVDGDPNVTEAILAVAAYRHGWTATDMKSGVLSYTCDRSGYYWANDPIVDEVAYGTIPARLAAGLRVTAGLPQSVAEKTLRECPEWVVQ